MLSTWALLLAGDLDLHGGAVLHEAWLITAGGLTQTVIAVAAWPLRPFGAERRAVADTYRALAAYARAPGTAALQSTAAALAAAAETVGAGPCAARRARNAACAGRTGRMGPVGTGGAGPHGCARRRPDPGAAARALDAIAAGSDPAPSLTDLGAQRARDRRARRAPAGREPGRLDHGRRPREPCRRARPGAASHPLQALRAEITLRSSAFRHALRLSVALIVAGIVYRGLCSARDTGSRSRSCSCSSPTTGPR